MSIPISSFFFSVENPSARRLARYLPTLRTLEINMDREWWLGKSCTNDCRTKRELKAGMGRKQTPIVYFRPESKDYAERGRGESCREPWWRSRSPVVAGCMSCRVAPAKYSLTG